MSLNRAGDSRQTRFSLKNRHSQRHRIACSRLLLSAGSSSAAQSAASFMTSTFPRADRGLLGRRLVWRTIAYVLPLADTT